MRTLRGIAQLSNCLLTHMLLAYWRKLLVAMRTTGPDEQNVMVSIEGLDVAELSVRGAFAVEPLCEAGDGDIKQHYYVLRSVWVYCLWREHASILSRRRGGSRERWPSLYLYGNRERTYRR